MKELSKLNHYYGRWIDINHVINAKIRSPRLLTGEYLGHWLLKEIKVADTRGDIIRHLANYNLYTQWKK